MGPIPISPVPCSPTYRGSTVLVLVLKYFQRYLNSTLMVIHSFSWYHVRLEDYNYIPRSESQLLCLNKDKILRKLK